MRIITCSILAVTLMLALVAGAVACKQESGVAKRPASQGVEVSWAKGYRSIRDLATDSHLIAIGVIDRLVETVEESKDEYRTSFAFRIEMLLKGKEAKEVVVHQMGAPDKPWTVAIDDPLFQIGEKYLLFLESRTSGKYVYYGPNSRYKVAEGKVYSMNYVLQSNAYKPPEALDFNGVELMVLTSSIAETLDTVRFLGPAGTILLAGETGRIEFVLATGKQGQGEVSYAVSRVSNREGGSQIPMPEGMAVSIEPAGFIASPYNDYRSVVHVSTDEQVIVPGEYWISVEFSIGGTTSGQHILRVVIDKKKLSEIETRSGLK